MTDYKQLCAELLDWLNFYNLSCNTDASTEQLNKAVACADKARAELAEQDGPTDEEIMELMPQEMRDDLAAAARSLSSFDPDNIKAASFFFTILNRHAINYARAVLTKWNALKAPTLMERAVAGDATAAKQFLHEAGFTDKHGQWLPQYQPIPDEQG